jgi:glycosyltransferase involved in cell wall biosynthesis
VADLVGVLPVQRWVYYCVDDFTLWPGLDGAALRVMEERLVADADKVIAVSAALQDKMARMGRPADLLTHGIDPDFWIGERGSESFPAIAGLERPLVIFWGVVDRRMDTEFVRRLSNELERGTVLLAGPLSDPDPALLHLPKVVHIGVVPFAQLPSLAREAAVLIMPYADLPVNRAIQPLKLKEYLATGRPVVVSDLPATREWADCLDLAATPGEFSQLVRDRLLSAVPNEQKTARARLDVETWAGKAQTFEAWVCEGEQVQMMM